MLVCVCSSGAPAVIEPTIRYSVSTALERVLTVRQLEKCDPGDIRQTSNE
jgi:hypothetical protein